MAAVAVHKERHKPTATATATAKSELSPRRRVVCAVLVVECLVFTLRQHAAYAPNSLGCSQYLAVCLGKGIRRTNLGHLVGTVPWKAAVGTVPLDRWLVNQNLCRL